MATPIPMTMPGPAPAAASTPSATPVEEQALGTLLDILKNAASPDMARAQTILMQRLALEGDVIGSRIPAPRNISEVGGYINLLETLNQPALEAQMLASTLGVAGPSPPLGWDAGGPPLALAAMPNDRPATGPAAQSTPLSITVRSDLVAPLGAALQTLHAYGALLPLWTMPPPLPSAGSDASALDVLALLGRVVNIVPAAALQDPLTDPVVVARPKAGTPNQYQIVLHVNPMAPRYPQVPAGDWQTLVWDNGAAAYKEVAISAFPYLPLAPVLAGAGFYPQLAVLPTPSGVIDYGWTRWTNTTGLIAGISTLGDELAMTFAAGQVAASALATATALVWDGTTFSPRPPV